MSLPFLYSCHWIFVVSGYQISQLCINNTFYNQQSRLLLAIWSPLIALYLGYRSAAVTVSLVPVVKPPFHDFLSLAHLIRTKTSVPCTLRLTRLPFSPEHKSLTMTTHAPNSHLFDTIRAGQTAELRAMRDALAANPLRVFHSISQLMDAMKVKIYDS